MLIYNAKVVEIFIKSFVNKCLKCARRVTQIKEYNNIFK